jgi:16S rRNA G966 N2-methylase RsmD
MELILKEPNLPENWDYDESVKKTGNKIYKWKNLTEEIATELWVAREVLAKSGAAGHVRNSSGTKVPLRTWSQYCEDIGVTRQVANRWLNKWFPKKKNQIETPQIITLKNDYNIQHGDFREVAKDIPDNSISLIFTDPPYDRKSLPLYGDLAEIASRILIDGGSLVCYFGQYLTKPILDLMTDHMRFWWIFGIVHTGQKARMKEYGIVVNWKPLYWFVKNSRLDKTTFVDDLVISQREKDTHRWQQSEIEAEYYIGKLCPKDGILFDPFCGGGTTAIAALKQKRKYISCDIDEESVNIARQRIHDAKI